jgi:hypothetical protein
VKAFASAVDTYLCIDGIDRETKAPIAGVESEMSFAKHMLNGIVVPFDTALRSTCLAYWLARSHGSKSEALGAGGYAIAEPILVTWPGLFVRKVIAF